MSEYNNAVAHDRNDISARIMQRRPGKLAELKLGDEVAIVLELEDGNIASGEVTASHAARIRKKLEGQVDPFFCKYDPIEGGSNVRISFMGRGYQAVINLGGAVLLSSNDKPLKGVFFTSEEPLLRSEMDPARVAVSLRKDHPKYDDVVSELKSQQVSFETNMNGITVRGLSAVSAILKLGASFRQSREVLALNGQLTLAA